MDALWLIECLQRRSDSPLVKKVSYKRDSDIGMGKDGAPAARRCGTSSTPPCGRHDALEVLPSRGAGCAELWNRFFGLLRLEMGLGSGSMPHRWPSPTRGSGLKPWRSLRRWAALFF